MTAPESCAPDRSVTGEARPCACANPVIVQGVGGDQWCGGCQRRYEPAGPRGRQSGEARPDCTCPAGLTGWHAGYCAIQNGGVDRRDVQPPAPPSVGDATPDNPFVGPYDRDAILPAQPFDVGHDFQPSAPPAALPPIPEGPRRSITFDADASRPLQQAINRWGLAMWARGYAEPRQASGIGEREASEELSVAYDRLATLLASPSVVAASRAGTAEDQA